MGKGSGRRQEDTKRFESNFDKIEWGKRNRELLEDKDLEQEVVIPEFLKEQAH